MRQIDRDQLGDAAFGHRHAEKAVDTRHRDAVVGYDQEAGAGGVGDLAEQGAEPIDIGVVELAILMPSWSPNCPDWDPAPSTPCRRCRLAMCPSSPSQACNLMAALAEFERDFIRERIKSGIAAAKARGKRLDRQPRRRRSGRKATKVLKLAEAGLSYRLIGRHVGLSKNTVGAILQRARAANQ